MRTFFWMVVLSVTIAGCGDVADDDLPRSDAGADAGPNHGDAGPADGGDAGPDPTCRDRWPGLRIGTALDDEVRALAIDGEGRVVVGGFERGRSEADTLSPTGDATGFVQWYREDGTSVGRATLESEDADVVEALAVTADGRVAAAASTLGTLPQQTSGGQYDAAFALFELGRSGPVHVVQVGGVHPERPHQLVVSNERWVAAGWTDVYVPTNFVQDWEDPIVVEARLGASGFEDATVTRWPSPETDFAQAVHVVDDDTNDLVVADHSTAGAARGAWIRRLRPDGSELWARQLSASGFDSVMALLPDGAGRVRAVGSTFLALGGVSNGQQDVYVATLRLDDGEWLDTVQVGTADTDWVHDATLGPDGAVYVTGETLGTWFDDEPPDGTPQAFAVRIGPERQRFEAWQKNSPGVDVALAIRVDPCGRALVGGWSQGALVDGAPSAGGRDGFVLQANLRPWPVP